MPIAVSTEAPEVPPASPGRLARLKPVIIAVIACLIPDHKVPEQEQLLTAGSVCFALLQSAQALGFGAQWLTGWAAYDSVILQTLGLQANEKIAGFIHIGTARLEVPERERPDAARLLSEWSPPAVSEWSAPVVSPSNHA